MQLHPRVTRSTIDFAARFEGLRRTAARLPGGGWTLGYGHSRTARAGATVDEADARALLAWDLSQSALVLDRTVFAPLDANQFDALCAFAFNVGEAAFGGSDVVRHLNEGRPLQAASALELWRRATVGAASLVVDAVVRRRAAEKALFLTPPDGFPAAPTPVLRPELDRRLTSDSDRLAGSDEVAVRAIAPLDGDDPRAVLAQPATPDALAPPRLAVEDAAEVLTARFAAIAGDPEPPPVVAPAPLLADPPPAVEAPSPPSAVEPPPLAAEPPPPPQAVAGAEAPAVAPPPREGPPAHDARSARPGAGRTGGGWPAWIEAGVVWGAIGMIGLVLFAVAAVCILDRPTLGCLLVGLIGVLAMAPAAVRLLSGTGARRG